MQKRILNRYKRNNQKSISDEVCNRIHCLLNIRAPLMQRWRVQGDLNPCRQTEAGCPTLFEIFDRLSQTMGT